MSKCFFAYLIFSIVFVHSTLALDRRRDQFPTDFGYLVAPIPYIEKARRRRDFFGGVVHGLVLSMTLN